MVLTVAFFYLLFSEIVNALPISIENNKSLDSSENTSNGNELNNFLLSLILALIVANKRNVK